MVANSQLDALPLRLVIIKAPFHQCGLDFIGPINPPSSQVNSNNLTAIYYFSKWVEANSMKNISLNMVCEFLKELIMVRFGVPMKLVIDNASYFSSSEIINFFYDNGINIRHYFDYFLKEMDMLSLVIRT